MDNHVQHTRRGVLKSLTMAAVAASSGTVALAATAPENMARALIAAHRAAYKAYAEADPLGDDAFFEPLMQAEDDAWEAITQYIPRSLDEVFEVVAYCHAWESAYDPGSGWISTSLIRGWAKAVPQVTVEVL